MDRLCYLELHLIKNVILTLTSCSKLLCKILYSKNEEEKEILHTIETFQHQKECVNVGDFLGWKNVKKNCLLIKLAVGCIVYMYLSLWTYPKKDGCKLGFLVEAELSMWASQRNFYIKKVLHYNIWRNLCVNWGVLLTSCLFFNE